MKQLDSLSFAVFCALLLVACDTDENAPLDHADDSRGEAADGPLEEVTPRACLFKPPFANNCAENRKLTVVDSGNIDQDIPNDLYNGTLSSMVCHDIVVPADSINYIERVEVAVAIEHSWVGDLVVRLISPTGKALTVLNRPGKTGLPDDGTGCCGSALNVVDWRPLHFYDGGTVPAESMADWSSFTHDTICIDDGYTECIWRPAPDGGLGTALSDYYGDLAAGTWKLCAGDSHYDDLGYLHSVKLIIQRVRYDPTP